MKWIKPFNNYINENSIFKSNNTEWKKFKYEDNHMDFSHGQHYYTVTMYDGDKKLASCNYSIFNDIIYITFIESIVKGKGYGTMLMEYLADKYGYENLERSILTPDGVNMRKRLDKSFGFDYKTYKESLSKHINLSTLDDIKKKHPIVAEFLYDMIRYGYENTWKQWGEYLRDNGFLEDFDFNDISELSTWFKESITNNHDVNDEPPSHITDILNTLI